jgi:hypothetical protein
MQCIDIEEVTRLRRGRQVLAKGVEVAKEQRVLAAPTRKMQVSTMM